MNYELRIKNYGLSWLKRQSNPLIHYSLFIIPVALLCAFLLTPAITPFAHAQAANADIGPRAVTEKLRGAGGDLPAVSVQSLAGRIVRAALVLIGVVFFVLIIYGGSLLLAAGGNEEQVTKAKTIIVRSVIGLFIVLFAGAITQFITSYLARSAAPVREGAADDGVDRSAGSWCWWGIRCSPDEE
ncbi:hypothetical protein HY477_04040 [Candidatus Uhrbacteria bacterium]|nr:hypothetical protein [Candidatus Uhrbacteria bacterium]